MCDASEVRVCRPLAEEGHRPIVLWAVVLPAVVQRLNMWADLGTLAPAALCCGGRCRARAAEQVARLYRLLHAAIAEPSG